MFVHVITIAHKKDLDKPLEDVNMKSVSNEPEREMNYFQEHQRELYLKAQAEKDSWYAGIVVGVLIGMIIRSWI
jgi:hypothetical protein